jgi:CheY-like chemotaxis protein
MGIQDNKEKLKALMAARLKDGNKSSPTRSKPAADKPHTVAKKVETTHENLATVLIAEDDNRIAAVIANQLKTLRLECVTTDNGMEALMFAQTKMPQLIILDEAMPHMTGTEACQKIRELPDGLMVPIIMICASPKPETRTNAINAGVSVFIPKPFKMPELMQTIKDMLDYDNLGK